MHFNSTKILLANTMMIGVIMVSCSNNWISMWMGMELVLMSFIPLMQNENSLSSEAMIKYFIVQSIASTMFLFSIAIMLVGDSMMTGLNEIILTTSMLIKLGSAPFHNWVLMIIEPLSIFPLITMLTVIKLPPMIVMHQINTKFLTFPILLGMMISSVACLNQSSMRKTLGYSSIYNMSLMMILLSSIIETTMFLIIYSLMMIFLASSIKTMKINYINQMISNNFSNWMSMTFWINMLSMAGFPPLMGFFMKMMVIQKAINENQTLTMLVLVMTSMLVLLFYMRLTFTSMLTFNSFKKWMLLTNPLNQFLFMLNILTTPILCSSMINL
uniref:NADH dehydrogenase subunit 2 n=1 Tax=Nesophrosyne sp. 242 GMB-2012 TaxID=1223954 RepID=UPI002181FF56|nr:NADH dehydrogenase subunit 2 [Nesophrosyne sp. 242 GMB-2012]UVI59790.1 NADH dehydrogenase subunit 2 [Nesophrosyne sp. 242 GMB-2012]